MKNALDTVATYDDHAETAEIPNERDVSYVGEMLKIPEQVKAMAESFVAGMQERFALQSMKQGVRNAAKAVGVAGLLTLAACGGGGGGSSTDSGNTGGGDPTCLTANGLTCDADNTIGLDWRDTTDASQRDPATGPEFTWAGETYGADSIGSRIMYQGAEISIYSGDPTPVGDCVFTHPTDRNKNIFATCGDVVMEFEWVVSGYPSITITAPNGQILRITENIIPKGIGVSTLDENGNELSGGSYAFDPENGDSSVENAQDGTPLPYRVNYISDQELFFTPLY